MQISFDTINKPAIETLANHIPDQAQYLIDAHWENLIVQSIQLDNTNIGFVIISKCKTQFHPANCILTLHIDDAYLGLTHFIWKNLTDRFTITYALGSTEDPSALSTYIDNNTKATSIAYGFIHGENLNELAIPDSIRIFNASLDNNEDLMDIWTDIYNYYNISKEESTDELNRTIKQLKNGDMYILEIDKQVVGMGFANFTYESNNTIEIGYAIKPTHWNKGYATLMAKYLKQLCQNKNKQAVAHCGMGNIQSLKVLIKAGMILKHRNIEFTF